MDRTPGTTADHPAPAAHPRRKCPRLLPLCAELRQYDRTTLLQDLLAGTITAILLVPQALAYALLAGLPAEVGLYASIIPPIVYALFGTSRTLAVGPVAFNAVMMLLGGTWLVLGGLATGELPRWEWRPGGIAAMVYLAVFGSALAYTAYSWLLKRVPADRVGTFAYVNPAVAAVLGWAVLGESLGALQLAGMLVVLLGVALVTLPSKLA